MPRKMTYSQMREAGLCCLCGKPSKKSMCEVCLAKQKERQRDSIKFFKEIGLCKCGNRPVKGKRSCQECLDKARKWYKTTGRIKYKEQREKRISNGLCVTCGIKEVVEGRKCEECKRKERLYKFEMIYGMPIA